MSAELDRELLRRFEPVIRYTRGERFFPIRIEPYIANSSLWMQQPGEAPDCLVPEGYLTLEKLAQPRAHGFGTVYYLKFIEPLNIKDLAVYTIKRGLRKEKDPKKVFHAGRGRLARVGYGSRFVDALFSLTLFARGRVPGDTAAAAALAYERMLREQNSHSYYGRVVRQNGWLALQYWFFYPFNNWRSGFFGANDHEADWEMIYIYISESDGRQVRPEWVAYASHDFSGDDLRRRWDDPELEKVGDHPVIYAGAGSHASYYAPGEYLAELELPFLAPLVRLAETVQSTWRNLLRYNQDGAGKAAESSFNIFRVPFVDYARGDGVVIGPGGDLEWDEPQLLDPLPEWAVKYRGLWGLYAQDPVAGENAPAGPVYDRDGSVRRSWYDPLGWAGLDKVPPTSTALDYARERCRAIESRRKDLSLAIDKKSQELLDLGVETGAIQGHPHLLGLHSAHQKKIAALSIELRNLRAQYAQEGALLEAMSLYADQLQRGEKGPARAHIRRAHRPASDTALRIGRLAEAWSAVSIGLVMFSFVGIALFARQYLILGLVAVVSIVVLLEAGFRRRLTYLVNNFSILAAIVATGILMYEFFWTIVVIAVVFAGGYLMWENLKELRA
jgi:hypothetical protein